LTGLMVMVNAKSDDYSISFEKPLLYRYREHRMLATQTKSG